MAKVALLIGVNEYEPGLNPLPSAVRDIEAMQRVLAHPEIGGFAETDIIMLPNPQRQEMEEAIEHLFAGRQKDDLVLFFFSGHGIKDDTGRLYLATRTTRKTPKGELIRSSAVAASFVHENMSRSRSKRQVVILDSCFSGAFAEGLSAKDDGTVNIREQLGGEGRAVLTSSSSTQYSFEQEGLDLSIYTHYLIEGITTGVADLDDDDFISVDELHEYASRKVAEIQPAMRPEIYAIREGFKIRLTKVPLVDPKQKYRKEVARYIKRGEISFVGRYTLDVLKSRLGLTDEEATVIENDTLAISRQQFREKLQQYEKAFTDALQQQPAISESDLNALRQNLQQILELRNEDTLPIEAQITASIEAYKQHLLQYEQALADAMRQEYPLSQITRRRFQQMQQEWQLLEADVAAIESRVSAEIEAYRQKLKQYEQTFIRVTRQEYPLSQYKRKELLQQQQNLALHYQDIASIEGRIIAEIEAYRQKLQQYEQAFITATQQEYPLRDAKRNELLQQRQILGLNQENIASIEARIIAEIEAYRQKLKQYEQIFTRVTRLEYPLSDAKRNELQQEQQNLGLHNQDITSIETRIIAEIEAYRQKLQQYEQVLTQVIQHEYPLKEEIREELRRFQKVLELNNQEVAKIEEKVVRQREANQHSSNSQHSDNNTVNLSKSGYGQKTQVIPDIQPSRRPAFQRRAFVPLQFVILVGSVLGAGLFGTLWMLNGGIFGKEDNGPRTPTIPNTPSVKFEPSVVPSTPSDRLNVIQITTNIELTNISSPQQAIAPPGSVLKIIKRKTTTTQEQNSDESISLRVCSVGEGITSATKPPDPLTPIDRKPVVEEGKVYTIKLSQYQKLLNGNSTPLAEGVTQCVEQPQRAPASGSTP